ncbi:Down syndrome cell adhesion molecule homolog [Tetranychus urticae]|uniref:Down syndrome cell adhesion molecule homolog n=1 Tax=Tetranychus urticae TaxID=32264 RepID=UPI00077BE602|nr:Down syndrome cell adhesion molecule homolog [Tetranychus urticae]
MFLILSTLLLPTLISPINGDSQIDFYANERSERQFPEHGSEPPSRPAEQIVHYNSRLFPPAFDTLPEDQNVTAQLGKSTFLKCRIKHITDHTISWVRQKDLHIISAGPFVYTSDERFEPKHVDHTDEWYLHIKYVQTADTGTYECQISTEPKMSLPFYLNVIEAKSEILGGPSTYYQSKDTINLTCIINQTASPPLFVYWFKDNQVLGFLSQTVNPSDSRIRVSTIKGPISISTLEITNARSSDSGNYSCRPVPQYVDPANITVNVLNGDNPAAMQHSNHHKDQVTSHTLLMVVLIMVSWSCWSGLCQSTLTVQGVFS